LRAERGPEVDAVRDGRAPPVTGAGGTRRRRSHAGERTVTAPARKLASTSPSRLSTSTSLATSGSSTCRFCSTATMAWRLHSSRTESTSASMSDINRSEAEAPKGSEPNGLTESGPSLCLIPSSPTMRLASAVARCRASAALGAGDHPFERLHRGSGTDGGARPPRGDQTGYVDHVGQVSTGDPHRPPADHLGAHLLLQRLPAPEDLEDVEPASHVGAIDRN